MQASTDKEYVMVYTNMEHLSTKLIFSIPYKSYIWREFSLAFAQLYPIGGHYYWRSIGTEFLSLHLLFLPLEVLPKGCHHR